MRSRPNVPGDGGGDGEGGDAGGDGGTPVGEGRVADTQRDATVHLEGFVWEALTEESARTGVSVQELVVYAVMYYLADADSGRIARQISRGPYSAGGGPEADTST
jgi:hypothetical protein